MKNKKNGGVLQHPFFIGFYDFSKETQTLLKG
jgi:hypothetical protein